MAGADSSAPQSDRVARSAQSAGHDDASHAFVAELYARNNDAKRAPAQDQPPVKPKPSPEQVAETRAGLAREEYTSILDRAARQAYDPTIFSNFNQLAHLYDKRIRNNRDAVAYAAQALKFTGDPYTRLVLNPTSFPDADATVGISLKFPTDGDSTHNGNNQPVAASELQTIDDISANSAAAKAGLRKGDRITYVDGISMLGRPPQELSWILDGVAGTKVNVTVLRDGKQQTFEMTRQAVPAEPVDAPDGKNGKFGMEYGMLGADRKHIATTTTDLRVNGDSQSLQPQTNDIILVNIIPGSAADAAGLKRGDIIRGINGQPFANKTFDEVGETFRGKVNEGADLTVLRKGQLLEVHAVRNAGVVVKNITAKDLGGGIEYIKLSEFTQGSGKEIQAAMEANPKAKGIILDLRGNPGGRVDEAVNTVALMMENGPVYTMRERFDSDLAQPIFGSEKVNITQASKVTEKGADGQVPDRTVERRKVPFLLNGRPLLVLVDGKSASASEIVAGALRDNRIATILGERSYGKGMGQNEYEGDDPRNLYKLKVTNFNYFTPSGFWPGDAHKNRIGLTPDIQVADDLTKGDPQLDAGIRWMQRRIK